MLSGKEINSMDKDEIARLLKSEEGKALLALLQKDGGKSLQAAADAVKRGAYGQAQQILTPVLGERAAALLMEKLRGGG